MLSLKTNSIQIHRLITYGVRLGYGSIGYLIYRVQQIRSRNRIVNTETLSIENGGMKKSKTHGKSNKSKKHRKTRKH